MSQLISNILRKLRIPLFCCIIIALSLSPLWLKLNFQAFNYKVPDSFYMLPHIFWISLFVIVASLFFYTCPRKNDLSLIIAVSAVVFIIFPLAQWPTVMGWDYYLNTYIAKLINMGANPEVSTYLVYGSEYPGAFILLNSFKDIIGTSYLESAIILSTLLKMLTLMLVYLVSKDLLGHKPACHVLLLFILGNFRFEDYFQYSPQALALPLFLSLLYLYLKLESRERRTYLLAMTLLILSIVISHPFTSVLVITTFIGIHMIHKIFKNAGTHVSILLLLLILTIWSTWQIYVSINISGSMLQHVGDLLRGNLRLNDLISAVLTIGRGIHNEALLLYRQVFQTFIVLGGVVGSILGVKNRKTNFLVGVFIGAIVFAFILVVLSEPPRRIWLDRALLLGALAPTVLTVYGLPRMHVLFPKRLKIKRLKIILPCIYIALIAPSFFASQQYTYMSAIKPWELAAPRFVSMHNGEHLGIASDGITLLLFRYFDIDNASSLSLVRERGYSLSRFSTKTIELYLEKRFLTSDLIVRSYRQTVDWYYIQGVDPESWENLDKTLFLLSPQHNRIYDNDYAQVYRYLLSKA
jgi:hypothetical protein